jgi:hypothetical protein
LSAPVKEPPGITEHSGNENRVKSGPLLSVGNAVGVSSPGGVVGVPPSPVGVVGVPPSAGSVLVVAPPSGAVVVGPGEGEHPTSVTNATETNVNGMCFILTILLCRRPFAELPPAKIEYRLSSP